MDAALDEKQRRSSEEKQSAAPDPVGSESPVRSINHTYREVRAENLGL